jgi:ADP-ribose pyrophosphatase
VVDGGPPPHDRAFLELSRRVLRVAYADGVESEPFVYDVVGRPALDAVVVAAHFERDGVRHVYLRSCLRPPVFLRPLEARAFPEHEALGALLELPAGLVEVDERTPDGIASCAARELAEEVGFVLDPSRLRPLGPSSFPAPGLIGERHYFFHVEVEPSTRESPSEDGSPLERGGLVVPLPLTEALELARAGELEDAKTELGLRRLAELLHH